MARKKKVNPAQRKEQKNPYSKDPKTSESKEPTLQDKGELSKEDLGKDAPKSNDPEWYARDPQLLLDAGSIPFSDVFGNIVSEFEPGHSFAHESTEFKTSATITQRALPGICVLRTRPSLGEASSRYSPANVAATALYTHVRYVNSGRKNYDQADLMLYCMAIADLYAYVNWLIRIYNCAFVFSQRNKYVGKSLIESQGVDPDSVVADLANFRYIINVFINKIASYAVPASINLFKKRAFEYAAIYSESAEGSIKDQLYMYSPAGFYRFMLDDKQKGSLQFYSVGDFTQPYPTLLTVSQLKAIGETLLSEMWGDEDFGLMSGDILKAFGGDIVTLSEIGEEGGIAPLYDPFVLHQMKNSTVFGHPENPFALYYELRIAEGDSGLQYCRLGDVYQDGKGNLISHHAIQNMSKIVSLASNQTIERMFNVMRHPIITIDAPVADPAMVVEVSRNMIIKVTTHDGGNSYIDLKTADGGGTNYTGLVVDTGDIIVERVDMYQIIPDNGNGRLFKLPMSTNLINRGDITEWGNSWFTFHFRYAPVNFDIMYTADALEDKMVYGMSWITPRSDLNNYTIQGDAIIARLHELCMLSLLYVPGVAKQVNYMK